MIVKCPKCIQTLEVDPTLGADMVRCGSCGATLRIKLPTAQQPLVHSQPQPTPKTSARVPARPASLPVARSTPELLPSYFPPAYSPPPQNSGIHARALWMTAGAIGGVAALALCGFLGFWLFGFASQHVGQLLTPLGDVAAIDARAQPSTLRADLESFQSNSDGINVEQLQALADRMANEFKRLPGYDAVESVRTAYVISQRVLAETDDPERTKAAWHLAQSAFEQLFRASVDIPRFSQDADYKPVGEFMARLASLGDRTQSYDASAALVVNLAADSKSRNYELARSLSAAVLDKGKSAFDFNSDGAHWSRAVWIIKDFIEVACCSPKTVAIATELVTVCENMEVITRMSEAHRHAATQGNKDLSNIARIASGEPEKPPPPMTADTPWGLSVTNLFVPKSVTLAAVRKLFPEAKWRLNESRDGISTGFANHSSQCHINGDDVVLQFHSRGYEKRVLFFVKVDDEAEFFSRLKDYKTHKLDRERRWLTVDLNLPRRKSLTVQ